MNKDIVATNSPEKKALNCVVEKVNVPSTSETTLDKEYPQQEMLDSGSAATPTTRPTITPRTNAFRADRYIP